MSNNQRVTLKEITNNFSDYKNTTVYMIGAISELEKATSVRGQYLKCKFGDETGKVDAKHWDEKVALDVFKQLEDYNKEQRDSDANHRDKTSVYVEAEVLVKDYKGNPDFSFNNLKLDFSKKVSEFSEKAKSDPKELYGIVKELIDSVEKPHYRKLLEGIFTQSYEYPSEEIKKKMTKIRNDFLQTTAALGHHHNYIFGLLEHSVNVVKTALLFVENYSKYYPLDRDLIITAGLIHDIGKIYEYTYEEGIGYSEEGPFVYHTVSGSILVTDLDRELEINMERMELVKLIHLITSHHGEYSEHGPNAFCPEAHLLALADNADSQANKAMRSFESGNPRKMRSRFN